MQQCLTSNTGKNPRKSFGDQIWAKIKPKISFHQVVSLAFFDFAQDCSLAQCLTSGTAKTSKKDFVAQIEAEMIFSILIFNLSVKLHIV